MVHYKHSNILLTGAEKFQNAQYDHSYWKHPPWYPVASKYNNEKRISKSSQQISTLTAKSSTTDKDTDSNDATGLVTHSLIKTGINAVNGDETDINNNLG